MKNIIKSILLAILILLPLSCSKDFLNKYPLDKISTNAFDPDLTLPGIYDALQSDWVSQRSFGFDEITPIGSPRDNNTGFLLIAKGAHTPFYRTMERCWGAYYQGIFRANDFLDRIVDYDMDKSKKQVYIAEARFLRAYFYYRLEDLFGGVPLVLKPLSIDESRQQVRASDEETVKQIMDDLDFAVNNLSETPRVTGAPGIGAALALKARVFLYHSNWQQARDAAEAVMDLHLYDIYHHPNNDSLSYAWLFDYRNEHNVEVIFDVQYDAPNLNEGNSFETYVMNKNSVIDFGYVWSFPSQYLINQYEHRDGTMPRTDTTDFRFRDYRMYYTVLFPGAVFNDKVYGPDYPGWGISRTRYVQRKYTIEHSEGVITKRFDAPNNFILIRFADVLLMYAEAQNELSGPDATVYDAVNRIRNRAGLPDLPEGLSQDDMRQAIHHERMVELAFEGLYYSDMRRWGKAGTLPGGQTTEEYINANPPTRWPDNKQVDTWLFDPSKHYLWPIPQSEIDNVPTLTQNPGW